MELTESQKSSVAEWVRQGHSLAEVQERLRDEFGITLRYMDVRFLVDDLDVSMPEPETGDTNAGPEPGPEDVAGQSGQASGGASGASDAAAGGSAGKTEDPEVVDHGGSGSVTVEVDDVTRPGAVVSGTVTFSDGKKLGWQLSASGQLGLVPGDDPEYRPGESDVQAFQEELERVLREKGL